MRLWFMRTVPMDYLERQRTNLIMLQGGYICQSAARERLARAAAARQLRIHEVAHPAAAPVCLAAGPTSP